MAGKSSASSRRWLREHFSDYYVKEAKRAGLRSRAAFKLKEIHERDSLFRPGMNVIDLGAAPGGWSELLVKLMGEKSRIIALDRLPMLPIAGVEFIQGDFSEDLFEKELLAHIDGLRIDWVISDMAPNFSGMDSVDLPRVIALAELALQFALKVLQPRGGFLVKLFQGAGFDPFLFEIRDHFKKVTIRKPKASRGRSNEVYILAQLRK